MDLSGISSSLNNNSLLRVQLVDGGKSPLERNDEAQELSRHHHHGRKHGRGTALHVFRQELRMSLKAQFRAELGNSHGAYAQTREASGPGDVADEALGIARQVVAQSPTTASTSLIQFRSRVHESINVVKQTVGKHDDMADVDKAVAKVDDGLAAMEKEAAATREASASVLDVDMRTRQRSQIKIRTQEGDVVKLSLKQFSELSATESQSVDGDSSTKETEIEFSSRSRMMLRVHGDLNEAELGAIEAVFGQAQKMADAFFGGDIGAAFKNAGAFEFNSEQLASVNMRFRMRQATNISYSETVTPAVLAPSTAAGDAPAAEPVVEPAAPAIERPSPVAEEPVAVETPIEDVVAVDDTDGDVAAGPPTDALSGFFEMVGSFLRSVSEGFESQSGNMSIRYQYSESFKLSLLQSVIHAVAPDDAGSAADAAVGTIDQMGESGGE